MTEPRRETDRTDLPVSTTAEIRCAFPALDRKHGGFPVAYFDGPGGTQVPRAVADAVADYLLNHNANTHWAYPTSQETDALIAGARQAVADLLNADPGEIVLGANMTTLTFQLSRTLARCFLEPGDEVVVTELDHHANVDPWKAMARDWGLTVRTVRMITESGQLDWDDLHRQVSPKTKLLAIGAASNALGTINDIPRAVELAKSVGALSFVDAVHYVPHNTVDVRAWDCDFLACSAYKFYGPHVGILYGKRTLLESLTPPKLEPAPDVAPDRFETGTQNHEGIAGITAAVDFLAGLATPVHAGETQSRRERLEAAYRSLHSRGAELITRLWNGLQEIPGVTLYGPKPNTPRTPTLSFTVKDVSSTDVSRALADRGIFASNGNFYALTVARRLGVGESGFVRLGCACYSDESEVDRVIQGVREIARR